MDPTAVEVLERLVVAHPEYPSSTIIRMLTRCMDEYPHSDLLFIEHAVEARLSKVSPEDQRP